MDATVLTTVQAVRHLTGSLASTSERSRSAIEGGFEGDGLQPLAGGVAPLSAESQSRG